MGEPSVRRSPETRTVVSDAAAAPPTVERTIPAVATTWSPDPSRAEAARRAAMARHAPEGPPLPEFGAEASSVPGHATPIQNVDALASFDEALRQLEGRPPGTKVRIAMYGASGTASDRSNGYLRTYAQARFGAGGPGFVPWAPLSKWYRHSEVRVRASDGWLKEHAQVRDARPDGHWGYLGASFSSRAPHAWVEIDPQPEAGAIATFEIFAWGQPEGGTLEVWVDGRLDQSWSTLRASPMPIRLRIGVPPGSHRLRLVAQGDGEVRGFGVAMESAARGVVVDTLGIDGTRMTNMLQWDWEAWAADVRAREVSLLAFSFGTNESSDRDAEEDPDASRYRAQLGEVLRRLRATFPATSCLLLLPGDFPRVTDGKVQPRPRLLAIHEIQRNLAEDVGCAWWDGLSFMGGAGSMEAFVHATPPLAASDYLHFNARGAVRKAQAFTEALLGRMDR